MQAKSLFRIIALLIVVALAVPLMAKPVSKSLSLSQQARIGGTLLDAGTYKLLIDGTTLTIKQGKRVIAQVEGQWEPKETKNDRTSVLRDANGAVKEIRFQGERRVLVIRQQ